MPHHFRSVHVTDIDNGRWSARSMCALYITTIQRVSGQLRDASHFSNRHVCICQENIVRRTAPPAFESVRLGTWSMASANGIKPLEYSSYSKGPCIRRQRPKAFTPSILVALGGITSTVLWNSHKRFHSLKCTRVTLLAKRRVTASLID